MSYILDALRKSEQERNQSRVVDNPASAPMLLSRSRTGHWPWWLLPLVLLNLAVLGYLFWHSGYNEAPGQAGRVAPAPEVEVVMVERSLERARSLEAIANRPAEVTPLDAQSLPVPQQGEPESPGFRTGQTLSEPVAETAAELTEELTKELVEEQPRPAQSRNTRPRDDPVAREGVPLLIDQPEAFRRQVPDLVFNSHVYSSSPGSRRVIINQQYLAEGDRVGPLRLLEITPGGVILSLDNTPFAVAVVHNWIQPR